MVNLSIYIYMIVNHGYMIIYIVPLYALPVIKLDLIYDIAILGCVCVHVLTCIHIYVYINMNILIFFELLI